ncbi:hypothetical protein HU762_23125 [Pseudomonas sp. SWRI92]|uniref:Uncharacterized protein n=1 Tax=Pseudomonas marvdashtae TaxID=2745500 RepID=A0A923JQ68_9PSED|nr:MULTISPECIES: hypothetical protein [Pseudomonas]MBC3376840.1 hypothetical protein [Pseudomonas sp. SWRI92]MBV4550524.1 hypothetical protein [Pseudomonas marvdashtae]
MKGTPTIASCVLSAACFACLPPVDAATLDITAQFRADSSKPQLNTFVNTTPNAGYCVQFAALCQSAGIFSLSLRTGASGGPIQANHEDARQGAMLKVPANWRRADVIHSGTGHTEAVEVRVVGIGGAIGLTPNATEIVGGGVGEETAYNMIFGSSWWHAPGPCTSLGSSISHAWFFWRASVEDVCAKPSRYLISQFKYQDLSFAYELRTPNPLKMAGGQYRGSLTLGIGPGRDFDFGDVVVPDDSALTLNFTLDVEHVLKVEIPPGGNRVELEPREGWQAWLNNGSKPTVLSRDQSFHISTSSPFSMKLQCRYMAGTECGMTVPGSGIYYPVDVYVTLPDGLTNTSGQPVSRRHLPVSGFANPVQFLPVRYIDRKPGTLHFQIRSSSVAAMLDREPGAYFGSVTVIWDSEV